MVDMNLFICWWGVPNIDAGECDYRESSSADLKKRWGTWDLSFGLNFLPQKMNRARYLDSRTGNNSVDSDLGKSKVAQQLFELGWSFTGLWAEFP